MANKIIKTDYLGAIGKALVLWSLIIAFFLIIHITYRFTIMGDFIGPMLNHTTLIVINALLLFFLLLVYFVSQARKEI